MCRVPFNPQGQTYGLKGTAPRTGLPMRQMLLSPLRHWSVLGLESYILHSKATWLFSRARTESVICTRYSRLKLTRPTSCKCVLMIRSRAIVIPVETSSSRIMPWQSVSPCDLRCPAATRGHGGSTPSYGLRFGLVGTFPTVVLSLSILAASLSHAVSVREDGHSRSRSSSDTGTVCATPSSCPLA